jgi:type II secretory pathway pseudopilin PulG
MLVATFGPTTGWQGREIIWDVDRFILVGHGAVPAAGVLDYDRLGQLVWTSPELRAWVASVAQWEAGGQAASPGRIASYAGAGSAGGGAAATGRRGLPAWAIVLIVLGAAFVVLSIVMAIVVPMVVVRATETLSNDAAVRDGVRTIQLGIESYAAEHNGTYPAAGEVNGVGLGGYLSMWPTNPYTDLPMADGGGAGNFRYTPGGAGGAYRLTGYGRDGKVVIELGGGSDTTI